MKEAQFRFVPKIWRIEQCDVLSEIEESKVHQHCALEKWRQESEEGFGA